MIDPTVFDGQLVDAEFMNRVETDLETAILARTAALQVNPGILNGLSVTSPSANTLTIEAGLAYDLAGERLEVVVNTNVSFAGHGALEYVMLALDESDGTVVVDPLTGEDVNTRRTAGWQILYSLTPNPAYVTLARITSVNGSNIATLDLTVKDVWAPLIRTGQIQDDRFIQPEANGLVTTHVFARGTGVVTDVNPHGQKMADLGFKADLSPIVHQARDHAGGFEPASRAASTVLSDQDEASVLTIQAVLPGREGDEISIELVIDGLNTTLSVEVTGFEIVVQLATDEIGNPISTAAEVAALLVADLDVTRLVTVTVGQDGSGVVQSFDQTYLTGGLDFVQSDYGLVRVRAGQPDSLEIVAPVRGDSVLIDGNRLKTTFTPSTFTFNNQHEFAALYDLYSRPDGTAVMDVRARFGGPQNALGLQIVEIDDLHPTGRFGLVLSIGNAPTVSWAGGPAVRLDMPARSFNGNKQYRLQSGLAGSYEILIQVTFDKLATDSQVDIVEIMRTKRRAKDLPLAQVWWSGRASGRLGTGLYGQSGTPQDKRPLGNLRADQFDRTLVEQLDRIADETRANGFVRGGSVRVTGALTVAIEGAICWIDGKRIRIGAARLTLPASSTVSVVADRRGAIRFTTDTAYNELLGEFFARIAQIETDATTIHRIQDERVLLGEVDESRLLGHHLRADLAAQQVPRLTVPQGLNGSVPDSVACRTLLLETAGPPGIYTIRIYLMTFGLPSFGTDDCGIEITMNARWCPTYRGLTNVWVPDSTQYNSSRTAFKTSGFIVNRRTRQPNQPFSYWYDYSTSPTWDNDSTAAFYLSLSSHSLGMGITYTSLPSGDAAGLQNPPYSETVQNRLLPKSIVKMWGHLDVVGGGSPSVAVGTGFNISTGASIAGNTITVALPGAPLSIDDVLLPGSSTIGDLSDAVVVASDNRAQVRHAHIYKDPATHFAYVKIELYDIADVTGAFEVYFIVMAAQAG